MDGIFGVGLPEMLIIALVIFIIGGPTNSTKWARELGRIMRKTRETWQQIMADIEKDVPGTQEAMNAVAEISQSVREITTAPQRIINETLRIAEMSSPAAKEAPTSPQPDAAAPPVSKAGIPATGRRYAAWLPPNDPPKG